MLRLVWSGSGRGQLNPPCSVAVDLQGCIFVAEYAHHRIQVFDSDGSAACQFGTFGAADGQLRSPCGVAVDWAGHLLVAESHFGNVRVQAL